jgi:GH15 family glucan-1,4-alpha-glucosidase
MVKNNLYENSLRILLRYQSDGGAFIACPNFTNYQYAWFRDGSFCAYALTLAGYQENAFRFHQWASQVVLRFRQKIINCIETAKKGRPPMPALCFHSRFTLDGLEVSGNWGFHQLDGLGTWLWTLNEFRRAYPEGVYPEAWQQAARLIKDYLVAMWKYPCSDCWEENEDRIHTYTLAAIYSGLEAYAAFSNDSSVRVVSAQVRSFILQNCIQGDQFVKSIGIPEVDANLLGLFIPYKVVEWGDPIFQATLNRIIKDLATPLGLHRYRKDTYYGGGEWVLLTVWLGWMYQQAGMGDKTGDILAWTEVQSTVQGELPEQVPHALFDENSYNLWVNRWGPIAIPLLWSHAMYVILVKLAEAGGKTRLT